MNNVLVRSLVCELSYTVTLVILDDQYHAKKRPSRKQYSDFMFGWGVEVATDLTVSENTKLNPTGNWTPIHFALGAGVNYGSTATADDNYNMFFRLSDLFRPDIFDRDHQDSRPCREKVHNQYGSPLVDIDLQIRPLLESRLQPIELQLAGALDDKIPIAGGKNVLSKTVSIKEEISGDITPTWTFTTGTVNDSGTFLSAGRERTHQVVVTFGELEEGEKQLKPLPEYYHQTYVQRAGLRASRLLQ